MKIIKKYKELGHKEFMSRWKEGIQKVDAFQTTKVNLVGYVIVMIGIVVGLVINFINEIWWLVIILFVSFIVSGTATLGAYQKYLILSKLNKDLKGGEDE